MKKKIGVVFSGCGVYDGSEISESVLTLLAIERAGAEAVCMAPNIDQLHVINHLTGEEVKDEKRNVLVESARIARGNIKNITDVKADDIDGLIIVGGYGAAKNLSDLATKGADCDVHHEIVRLVIDFANQAKAFAAMCIAPAVVAKVYDGGTSHPTLTIGNDKEFIEKVEKMGSKHKECAATDIVVDEEHKIITTPAFMVGKSISEVAEGIEKTVNELVKMI